MIGENIKRLRERNHVTQEELAEKLFVTRQAISKWENGKTEPDIETLQKIAEVFQVPIEEVIYGVQQEKSTIVHNHIVKNVTKGLSFGSALAMVISYVTYKSIGWAILHGLLGWIYVIYFAIKF